MNEVPPDYAVQPLLYQKICADIAGFTLTLIQWGIWIILTVLQFFAVSSFILGSFIMIGLVLTSYDRLTRRRPPALVPARRDRSPAREAPIPAATEADECYVCKVNERNYLAVPCGHRSVCSECKEGIANDRCPVCRARIEHWQRVYQ